MQKVLLLAMLCLPLFTQAQEKTLVAVSDSYPPYVDPQAPGEGLAMEIVRAAYKTQGYTVTLKIMPWLRAEKSVVEGLCDILVSVWRTDSRAKEMLFSAPYAVSKIKFIKRKDNPFEYTGLESLNGKRVGVIRGYAYSNAFNNATGFTREDVPRMEFNINKLLLKRIDLTLEDEMAAKVLLQRLGPTVEQQVDFTNNALASNPQYVSAGFKNPRNKDIIEAFNRGLHAIKADGSFLAIEKRYGVVK